jgi:hypothetical protein
MIRGMDPQSRCLRCGGVRLTAKTRLEGHSGPVYLWYKSPGGGFFDQGARLHVEGSACLDCGYVHVVLSDSALEDARKMPSFTPWK